MKQPQLVSATTAQLDELVVLAKTRTAFSAEQYVLLEQVLGTFVHVMLALQNAKTSIKRFRQMLFGARTESLNKVLKDGQADAPVVGEPPSADAPSPGDNAPSPGGNAQGGDAQVGAKAKLKPGHGRIGAQAYRGAPVIELDVPELQSGDRCPQCPTGKVYDSAPRTIVKVVGQPPLAATVYKLHRLRCRLCDATFCAVLPAGLSAAKYDHSCASMLAVQR